MLLGIRHVINSIRRRSQLSKEFSELDNAEWFDVLVRFSAMSRGKIDHGIDLTGNSKQLPTLILFEDGVKVERMPRCSRLVNGEELPCLASGRAEERSV